MTEDEVLPGIQKEHILQALQRIDEEGYPKKRLSNDYDVVYNGVAYPPKYVISLAGYFKDGRFLKHGSFKGGEGSKAFRILRDYGFEVLPKEETESLRKAQVVNERIHEKYTRSSSARSAKLSFSQNHKEKLDRLIRDLNDTKLFEQWVQHCHEIITEHKMDPKYLRMAIAPGGRLRVECGARLIWQFQPKGNGAEICFYVPKSIADKYSSVASSMYDYKQWNSEDLMSFPGFEVSKWEEIPQEVVQVNPATVENHYISERPHNRSKIREGSGTTNDALKYLIYNNIPINDFLRMSSNSRYFIGGYTWDRESQYNRFIENGIWENGYDDRFQDVVDMARPGDLIALKSAFAHSGKSILRISAIGIITSVEEGRMVFHVDWSELDQPKDLEGLGKYRNTIAEITNPDEIELIFGKDPQVPKTSNISHIPQNLILYGPPGTGKTYKLKKEFFQRYTDRETSVSAEQHFEQVAKDLSWWQAIALALMETGDAKVSEILANRWVKNKIELSESKNPKTTVWGTLQYHTVEESTTVKYKRRMAPLIFDKHSDSRWQLLMNEVEEQSPDLLDIKESVDNFKPDPGKSIRRYVFTTFHQSFSYEDFIEGIKPKLQGTDEGDVEYHIAEGVFKKLCSQASLDPDHRYAIFIDEINRGNIANIFGELITLIEKDKRKGCENEISVELPYSKKQFSVPTNVDIYGTMNTADRSVEALDTALRRRFTFEEMMPDPAIIEEQLGERNSWKGFVISEILKTINQRIEVLVDRDHLIGHAYFLSLATAENFEDELRSIFTDKVIPLLQEYFYNDYVKIGMVLGAGFVQVSLSENHQFAAIEDSLEMEYEDRKLYHIVAAEKLDLKDALSRLMNHKHHEQTQA